MFAPLVAKAKPSSDARHDKKTEPVGANSGRLDFSVPMAHRTSSPSWSLAEISIFPERRAAEALRSPGQPLQAATRTKLEPRFGQDFSGVRVHTDRAAMQSARDINAKAYTLGQDIAFGAGGFAPETPEGLGLLAHELTHVLQQRRGGPIPPLSGSAAQEEEANRVEAAVLAGQGPVQVAGGTGLGVARQHDPGDEDPAARLQAEHARLHRELQETKDVALDLLENEGKQARNIPRRGRGRSGELHLKQVIRELRRVAGSSSKAASDAGKLADQLEALDGEQRAVGARLRDLYQAPGGSPESSAEKRTPRSEVDAKHPSAQQQAGPASEEQGGSFTEQSTGETEVTEGVESPSSTASTDFAEHSAMVGGRLFAMVSVAGVLYAISNIHDFASAVKVSELLAVSFGAGAAAKAFTASGVVAMVVPLLLGMSSDQGPGVEERQRRATVVEQFLEKNFSLEEISRKS